MKKIVHKIIQGDCLEVMKKIPDNSIDFICADFPYNISNNPGLTMRGNKVVKADFGEWDKWDTEDKYIEFVFLVCEEYQRILKPNASLVLFFSYRYSGWLAYEMQRRGMFTFRNPIIFNKINAQLSHTQNGFRSCHEVAVWLVNDGGKFHRPRTFNFLGQSKMKNVLHYKIGRDGNKQTNHPTEKPEFLIGGLVEVFTNPNDIVLDSFAGGCKKRTQSDTDDVLVRTPLSFGIGQGCRKGFEQKWVEKRDFIPSRGSSYSFKKEIFSKFK